MKTFNEYFKEIPVLEGNRIILNAFLREDLPQYFTIIEDECVLKYLGGAITLVNQEPHITNWLTNINDKLLKRKIVITWCIRDIKTNQVIGRIDLGGFHKKEVAEISYHIDPHYWNQGIAKEAIQLVNDFGMNELKLKRIQALVRVENIASLKVLEANGYLQEGLLHHYPFGKEFHDVYILAKLKNKSSF